MKISVTGQANKLISPGRRSVMLSGGGRQLGQIGQFYGIETARTVSIPPTLAQNFT